MCLFFSFFFFFNVRPVFIFRNMIFVGSKIPLGIRYPDRPQLDFCIYSSSEMSGICVAPRMSWTRFLKCPITSCELLLHYGVPVNQSKPI